MRIKLASWYGDRAPGEEIDVDETTAKALRRDGRVAEVVEEPAPEPDEATEPAPAPAEPVAAPEAAAEPATGRKRR
jgi:hypothetical protein